MNDCAAYAVKYFSLPSMASRIMCARRDNAQRYYHVPCTVTATSSLTGRALTGWLAVDGRNIERGARESAECVMAAWFYRRPSSACTPPGPAIGNSREKHKGGLQAWRLCTYLKRLALKSNLRD
ncbi:MAG: hypothetical protein HY287_10780 [Planctomycetes bacterium]|nr:hypothetical protein [Planctomycetota bacterium]MBI3834803.1 hypothetical protein [Planctomycetota bacterium]